MKKWRYNPLTYELSAFQDPTKCMSFDGNYVGSPVNYVHCNGSSNQQFRVPSSWLPAISTNVLHSIRQMDNTDTCLDSDNDPLSLMECNDIASQRFVFDASTHQIKQGDYCLDTQNIDGTDTAFMNDDCGSNQLSQVSDLPCRSL